MANNRGRTTFLSGLDPPPRKVSFGSSAQRVFRPSNAGNTGRSAGSNAARGSQVSAAFAACPWSRASSIGPSETAFQDPRNIRTQNFKKKATADLLEFLEETDYSGTIQNSLTLTSKDVQNIVGHFLNKMLSGFSLENVKVKFDVFMVEAMKLLGYRGTFNKQHAATVSAPHSWPYILGVLDFMRGAVIAVDLGDYHRFLKFTLQSAADDDEIFDQDDEDFEPVVLRKAITCEVIYQRWLKGEQEDVLNTQARIIFCTRSTGISEAPNVRRELESIRRELNEMHGEMNPIAQAQSNFREAKSELDAADKLLRMAQEKEINLVTQIQKFEKDIQRIKVENKTKDHELEKLRQLKDCQKLSLQEITSLFHEKKAAKNQLKTSEDNFEQVMQIVEKEELEMANCRDVLEKELALVNASMMSVGLITETNREMELHANFMQDDTELQKNILPKVLDYRSKLRSEIRGITASDMVNQRACWEEYLRQCQNEQSEVALQKKLEQEKVDAATAQLSEISQKKAESHLLELQNQSTYTRNVEDTQAELKILEAQSSLLEKEVTTESSEITSLENSLSKDFKQLALKVDYEREVMAEKLATHRKMKSELDAYKNNVDQTVAELEKRGVHFAALNENELRGVADELNTKYEELSAELLSAKDQRTKIKKEAERNRLIARYNECITGIKWKPQKQVKSEEAGAVGCVVFDGIDFADLEGTPETIGETVMTHMDEKVLPQCFEILAKHK